MLVAVLGCNAVSVQAPDYNLSQSCVAFEAQKSSVPTEGKVEKTEFLKVFRIQISNPPKGLELEWKHCFKDPDLEATQIFQPVILPPPKAIV